VVKNKAAVEVVRRVWDQEDAVFIEVGEYADNPDYLCLRTAGVKSIEWFGSIDIGMSPAFAKALGEALLAAATEKEPK
jgi:hypothetical protein